MKIEAYSSFVCILLALLLTGCSDPNRIVLKSADGKKMLVYDAANFKPQAETAEDIAILYKAAGETIKDAGETKAFITIDELFAAMDKNDYRKLERVIVEYRSKHPK